MLRVLALLALLNLSLSGCARLKSPTQEQCRQAVTNLVGKSLGTDIEKAFPSEGDGSVEDMAANFLKGMGKELLAGVVVDEQKIAWCEVNMSLHDANCLRTAQSAKATFACGYVLNQSGELAKSP